MTGLFVGCGVASVHPEIFDAARRHALELYLVVTDDIATAPSVHLILDEDCVEAGDEWIVRHIGPADICVTTRMSLAGRALSRGAVALSGDGRLWNRTDAATQLRPPERMVEADTLFAWQLEAAIATAAHLTRRRASRPPRYPQPSTITASIGRLMVAEHSRHREVFSDSA